MTREKRNMHGLLFVTSWIHFLIFGLLFLSDLPVVCCQNSRTGTIIPMMDEATKIDIPDAFAKRRGKGKGHKSNRYHASSPSSYSYYLPPHSHPTPYFITRWLVNVKGKSQGRIISFPGSNLGIICFEPTNLFRLDNARNIGKANICVSVLRGSNGTANEEFLSDMTTFNVIGGSFTSQTTPFVESVQAATGSFVVSTSANTSQEARRENRISKGEGCFNGATGNVRVSGYLEANFTSEVFYFDYIYVVDLNLTKNEGCYFLHREHE